MRDLLATRGPDPTDARGGAAAEARSGWADRSARDTGTRRCRPRATKRVARCSAGPRPRGARSRRPVSKTAPRSKPLNNRPCPAEGRARGRRPPFRNGFGFSERCARAWAVSEFDPSVRKFAASPSGPWSFLRPRAELRRRMSILRSIWHAPIDQRRCRRHRNLSGSKSQRARVGSLAARPGASPDGVDRSRDAASTPDERPLASRARRGLAQGEGVP
jgi:hypothetical protein